MDAATEPQTKPDVKTIPEIQEDAEMTNCDAKEVQEEVKGKVEEKNIENGKPARLILESPELTKKIIRQIEYYFGDINLSRDKFLQEKIKLDEGWIPVSILLTFNRIKNLVGDNSSYLINAMKESKNNVIEISNDETKIRRNPENPLKDKAYSVEKSVYARGFSLNSKLDDILEIFSQKNIKVESVYMKRHFQKKTFKGSIFVSFPTEEAAEKFVKLEEFKVDQNYILRERRVDYNKRKTAEYEARKAERTKLQEAKEKLREEMKGEKKEEAKEEREKSDDDSKVDKVEKEENDKNTFKPENISKGCILRLTDLSTSITWKDIKDCFKDFAEIAFVEHEKGETQALVRFKEELSASLALEKAKKSEDKLMISDQEVTAEVLEGEEEISFWRAFHVAKMRTGRRNHKGHHGGGRGGRGGRNFRGGRGKGRGGRGGRDRNDRKRGADGPADGQSGAKAIKTD